MPDESPARGFLVIAVPGFAIAVAVFLLAPGLGLFLAVGVVGAIVGRLVLRHWAARA